MDSSTAILIIFCTLSLFGSSQGDNCNPSLACQADEMPCANNATTGQNDGCPTFQTCIKTKVPSTKPGSGECSSYCPVTCGANEIHCTGSQDATGCKKSDFCLARSENCTVQCPAICTADEVSCSGKIDSLTKCKGPDSCIPKTKKILIEHECPGFCDVDCSTDYIKCPQKDSYGCDILPICIPAKGLDKNGNLSCLNYCQVKCDTKHFLCSGLLNDMGCRASDFCEPIKIGSNNIACPPVCPQTCQAGFHLCQSGNDSFGCPRPTSCIDQTIGCPQT